MNQINKLTAKELIQQLDASLSKKELLSTQEIQKATAFRISLLANPMDDWTIQNATGFLNSCRAKEKAPTAEGVNVITFSSLKNIVMAHFKARAMALAPLPDQISGEAHAHYAKAIAVATNSLEGMLAQVITQLSQADSITQTQFNNCFTYDKNLMLFISPKGQNEK